MPHIQGQRMSLPEIEDLDAMAQLIGGKDFAELGPQTRAEIVTLVNQSDIADALAEMRDEMKAHTASLDSIEQWFSGSDHFDKYILVGRN